MEPRHGCDPQEAVVVLDAQQLVIELRHRGIVPVADAAGTRIDCLRGRIWITERGCTDDFVLEAGDSHVISRDGVAVVQALRAALVGLRASAARRPGGGLATRVERLRSRWAAHATCGHPAVAQPGAVCQG